MLISLFVFVIVISILILVHEFGHFIMARRSGVWVEEFGIGYPPRVYGKKVGETIYSINLLPIGGFVRLHGEQTEEGMVKPNEAFINKNKKTRVAILTSGVIMNFILAIIAFSVVYTFSGIPRTVNKVIISGIASNSPAEKAGLKPEEVILSVNDKEVSGIEEFIKLIESKKGQETTLQVKNINGETRNLNLIPRINVPQGEGPIGVAVTQVEIYFPPVWQRPFLGVYNGFQDAIYWGKAIVLSLGQVLADLVKGKGVQDVTGPVGIFAVTSEVSRLGILSIINFLGIFSVNLAIINILPFPALDGGRLFFVLIEGILGKRVIPRVEAAIHTAGMIILLTLLLAITISDVRRLITAGGISGFLENAVK